MPQGAASAQEVRAVLAKWTANDWRRGFALAGDLDATIRRACAVSEHEPLANNTGALALPWQRALGYLDRAQLLGALAPLARALERRLRGAGVQDDGDLTHGLAALRAQDDIGPGLASLASCRLGLDLELSAPAGAAPRAGPARSCTSRRGWQPDTSWPT
jgi:hypothetical protein